MIYALAAAAATLFVIIAMRLAADLLARRYHWRIGWLSTLLPGWKLIGCACCGTSWRYVRAHPTPAPLGGGRSFTIAVLCDPCWKELGSPAARIDYYVRWYENRQREGDTSVTPTHLTGLRAAVAAGL